MEDRRRDARYRQLLGEKVISQAEYDLFRATLEAAQARVASLETAVKTVEDDLHFAEVQLDNTQIRAPFDGVITEKHTGVGEMVTAGSYSGQIIGGAVFRLADFGSLEMEADVTEANLGKVRVGQSAEIVTDAYPDRIYRKDVIEIAPLAYIRGRTLNDSFIILDEAQNTTSEQMKMFLTRTGFNSKMVSPGKSPRSTCRGRRPWGGAKLSSKRPTFCPNRPTFWPSLPRSKKVKA